MNKNDVIGEAITTIPAWLSFLDMKEAEQQKILEEIAQDGVTGGRAPAGTKAIEHVDKDVPTVSPLAWLDEDAPPPKGEPQQPLAPTTAVAELEPAPLENSKTDGEETPPWSE